MLLYKDTPLGFGLISRLVHWVMAGGIVALFVLGWWMTGLDYYSPYYTMAPYLHKAAGMLLLIMLAIRLGWRMANVKPDDRELSSFERHAARLMHGLLYVFMAVVMISGYLIPTAEGQPIDVFGIFSVPALVTGASQEDLAGLAHEYSAYAIMILAGLHTVAALKHHFHDRSAILTRMWSGPPRP